MARVTTRPSSVMGTLVSLHGVAGPLAEAVVSEERASEVRGMFKAYRDPAGSPAGTPAGHPSGRPPGPLAAAASDPREMTTMPPATAPHPGPTTAPTHLTVPEAAAALGRTTDWLRKRLWKFPEAKALFTHIGPTRCLPVARLSDLQAAVGLTAS